MTHISSLDSGIYSYLDIFTGPLTSFPVNPTSSDFATLFTGSVVGTTNIRMPSVREFPAIGNSANITSVPVYGQSQSSQVGGQTDAPTMDVTVNWVANDMVAIEALKKKRVAFRFMMANMVVTPAQGITAKLAAENTEFYFVGRIESIQVSTSLTDSPTAVVSLSVQGDFVGPATIAAV